MNRRQLNDDRRRRFGAAGRTIALLCECGDLECHHTVVLTTEAFDECRPADIVSVEHKSPHEGGFGEAHTGFEPVPPP